MAKSFAQMSQNTYSCYSSNGPTAIGASSPPSSGRTGNDECNDSKSATSVRSSRSRGSAVLARAREYNRIIDENKTRAKSLERKSNASESGRRDSNNIEAGNRASTHERALASVRNDSTRVSLGVRESSSGAAVASGNTTRLSPKSGTKKSPTEGRRSSEKSNSNNHVKRSTDEDEKGRKKVSNNSHPNSSSSPSLQQERQLQHDTGRSPRHQVSTYNTQQHSPKSSNEDEQEGPQQQKEGIVTPELLVDALSGHEDGLLAIAERLMEHYDSGYDAMGEAIIDAFADVQKLFQHVVEAAHMEGAAFEAGRREEEIVALRRQLENGGLPLNGGEGGWNNASPNGGVSSPHSQNTKAASAPTGPSRHDEFIDQDVRDVLLDAIRRGSSLRECNKHVECYTVYESACNSASALLPVDSDHRGRLQLSIARSESMSADRACAILKYAMDDVLRSGLNSNSKVLLPDPSTRGDCVLSRPKPKKRSDDYSVCSKNIPSYAAADGSVTVVQSHEEALASLVEEMKEVLGAPVYDSTPLQSVADRFWVALAEAQKSSQKTEERLEQKLGASKGEFLMAREEWEEKLNQLTEEMEAQKKKHLELKDAALMEQARTGVIRLGSEHLHSQNSGENDYSENNEESGHAGSPRSNRNGGSVASFGSLAQHARSLVGTFSCAGVPPNDHALSNREVRDRRKLKSQSNSRSRRQRDVSPPSIISSSTSRSKSSSKKSSSNLNSPPMSRYPRTDF